MNISSDLLLYFLASTAIVLCLVTIQITVTKQPRLTFIGRKTLHIVSVGICSYVIHCTDSPKLLAFLFITAAALLYAAVKFQTFQISKGNSLGIALFPLSFALLLLSNFPQEIVALSALILAIADPVASIFGFYKGKIKFIPFAEEKSLLGSSVFFVLTFSILVLSGITFSISLLIVAGFITLSEAISWRGSDNLSIPLVAAVVLLHLDRLLIPDWYFSGIALLLIFLITKRQWLTTGGIVTAVFLAASIVFFMGAKFLLLPTIFLVAGSLLSKLNHQRSSEKNGRTGVQVLANSGAAILLAFCYLMNHETVYLYAFAVSFAIATADTCSSEIGRKTKGPTLDILSLRKVQPGLSGGISVWGTVAGLIGSLSITLAASQLIVMTNATFFTIVGIGFLGMLIDSFLGSAVQAKYEQDGMVNEDGEGRLIKGLKMIDNDMVNFLSISFTTLLFLLLYHQCKLSLLF